ncbi:transmembrane protein [Cystoisospora suis]|uniref:Transmembrane protein n=1 Tax=Cystoisospora suis TaxID=483139 RepID=A0A2C6LEG3_9APIC|nr:transmembrane protein [Cystoisospora suis]
MSVSEICQRTIHFRVPVAPSGKERVTYALLGLLNCVFFGLGMIIIGFLENDTNNMMIGVLQLLLPVVGWIWAVVWGILIMLKAVFRETLSGVGSIV